MSTVEIAAVAAAAVVVLIIVIALVARGRKRGGEEPKMSSGDEGSMFDSPPSDTLAKLGKPEHRGEAPSLTPDEEPLAAEAELEPAEPELAGEMKEPGGPQEPDEKPAGAETQPEEPGGPASPAGQEPVEQEPVESLSLAGQEPPDEQEPPNGQEPPDEAAAVAAEPTEDTAPEAAAEGNFVALSSIIVTTSNKIVDLDDPEIRRMLTDLVTFEIDQAAQFKEQGQNIDAVLQLTEAEKICRALGKEDTAGEISAMMRELRA